MQDPLLLRSEERVVEPCEGRAGERVALVQNELEGAREGALDSGPAQLRIPLPT